MTFARAVSWKLRLQICVVLFTTKTNYIAFTEEDKSCYGRSSYMNLV